MLFDMSLLTNKTLLFVSCQQHVTIAASIWLLLHEYLILSLSMEITGLRFPKRVMYIHKFYF